MEAEAEGGGSMTGRDAANYILINRYDDDVLVIEVDGKLYHVADIVKQPLTGYLYVITDEQEDE